ncbi:MAG: hypothetical protein WC728_15695 [Elusimicrobiota bacterium]
MTPIILAIAAVPALAGLCPKWGPPVQIGSLDPDVLTEASGLAVSRTSDRLYHMEDSGTGPWFYVSDPSGDDLKKVEVLDFAPLDPEDLTLGPCGDKTCLYIGDIGDNLLIRSDISVALVPEEPAFKDRVRPLSILQLTYPDGPRNAEGLAVHPNGDLFIITKEEPRKKGTAPALIFRLPKKKLLFGGPLEPWGEVDVAAINPKTDKYGKIVSSFDISPDGKRFVLLTYANAIEFDHDLSKGPFKAGRYSKIPLKALTQQEAVAYLPDGRGLLYTSERKRKKDVPLMRVECYR